MDVNEKLDELLERLKNMTQEEHEANLEVLDDMKGDTDEHI